MRVEYLTLEETVLIHEKVVEIGGGSSGILDINSLLAALERPKAMFAGKLLYPTIWLQAAALLQSLTLNHPFVDGNKRTAFFCMHRFLYKNNRNLSFSNDEILRIMLGLSTKKISIEKLAKILEKQDV